MKQETHKAETCPTCKRITYNAEYSITCDACGVSLSEELKDGEHQYLDMTIFKDTPHPSETEDLVFCNWAHLVNWARQLLESRQPFNFVKLPYLSPRDLVEFIAEFKQ